MILAPGISALNVRNAPRVAPDTLVGRLQAGPNCFIEPSARVQVGSDRWVEWGNLFLAELYDGRRYLVEK